MLNIREKLSITNYVNNQNIINKIKKIDKIPPNKIKRVSEEFTAVFLKTMLKNLLSEFQKDSFFGNSFEGKLYKEMLWGEYIRKFAQNGGFGFTKEVYKFLKDKT